MIQDTYYETLAINYIEQINGKKSEFDSKIAKSLVQSLNNIVHSKLPETDFYLLVNQFVNLVQFGPITNLELILTEYCNLNCNYCFVKSKKPTSMPDEIIRSAINFLVFYSGNKTSLNITIFGGEPLLEKEKIYSIIDYCNDIESENKSKKINISITTNGTLISEELLEKTRGRINYLLSIDGKESTHNKHRMYKDGTGSFKNVFSKIHLLKKHQPWLGARMTVLPDTAESLCENISSLHTSGINQFLIGLSFDSNWGEKELKIYEEQLLKTGKFYISKKKSNEAIRMTLFEGSVDELKCHENKWGCAAGRSTISIDRKGNIYPCSKFVGYEGFACDDLQLGNVFDGITNMGLRKVISRTTHQTFKECSSCFESKACFGGCPADNYYLNKDLFKPGKAHCDLKKIENRVLKLLRPSLAELDRL